MVQPCVTAAMAQECTEWPAVSNYLSSYLAEKLASKTSGPLYESWGRSAVDWLRKTAMPVSVVEAATEGPPAITDGKVEQTVADDTQDDRT